MYILVCGIIIRTVQRARARLRFATASLVDFSSGKRGSSSAGKFKLGNPLPAPIPSAERFKPRQRLTRWPTSPRSRMRST